MRVISSPFYLWLLRNFISSLSRDFSQDGWYSEDYDYHGTRVDETKIYSDTEYYPSSTTSASRRRGKMSLLYFVTFLANNGYVTASGSWRFNTCIWYIYISIRCTSSLNNSKRDRNSVYFLTWTHRTSQKTIFGKTDDFIRRPFLLYRWI